MAADTSSDTRYEEIAERLTGYGVSAEQQQSLFDKLDRGELPDSLSEANDSVRQKVVDLGTTSEVVDYFSDGSVRAVKTEKPVAKTGDMSTPAVEGCTATNLSGGQVQYVNCTVSGWFTGVQLAFGATFTTPGTTGIFLANIDNYFSPNVQCTPPLTCTAPEFEVLNLQQTATSPAHLGLRTVASSELTGTTTTYLYLYVQNNEYYTN